MFVAEYRDHSQNDREPPVMRAADAMFSSYRAHSVRFLANQLSHTPA